MVLADGMYQIYLHTYCITLLLGWRFGQVACGTSFDKQGRAVK
jgi:hypothetical protein